MPIDPHKKIALTSYRIIGLFLLCAALPACVNQTIKSTSVPSINTPSVQVEESLLLDASIAIFDPGLEDYDQDNLVYPEVRKAEARYMPTLLSQSMQDSGAWGAVRVVPTKQQISDLMVTGKILYSDGEKLNLHIIATDSRDVEWLNKKYISHASRYSYGTTTREKSDPFLAVYNTIANDLLQSLESLKKKERKNIRLVTELLFAQSFSPDAYKGYLEKNRSGRILVMRLPAEDDPMLERIRTIRHRDNVFIDTMQGHYGSFNNEMLNPYQEWRKLSYEEAVALQELKAESTRNLIAGGFALIAGIAVADSGGSTAARTTGNVAILAGGYLLKSGLEKRNEAEIHVQALDELGQSLEAEITPQVIELDDRSVVLSGNVEDQYAQWREILGDIYRAEIGQPDETPGSLDDTIEPAY